MWQTEKVWWEIIKKRHNDYLSYPNQISSLPKTYPNGFSRVGRHLPCSWYQPVSTESSIMIVLLKFCAADTRLEDNATLVKDQEGLEERSERWKTNWVVLVERNAVVQRQGHTCRRVLQAGSSSLGSECIAQVSWLQVAAEKMQVWERASVLLDGTWGTSGPRWRTASASCMQGWGTKLQQVGWCRKRL